LERVGYIDMIPEYQDEYVAKFNMTVPERKKHEEGPTHVYNAYQWGYYADAEDVDKLLEWLDPRGFNEVKLRKEIVNYRDKILKNMENRKTYLGLAKDAEAEKKEEEKKKEEEMAATNGKRMSTRGRVSRTAATTPEPPAIRCLSWQNTMALDEIGHLHSNEPPPVRSRKQSSKKRDSTVIAEPEPVTTRKKKALNPPRKSLS
jgi:hypothetical protein